MERTTKIALGGGALAGLLAWWYFGRDGADPIDAIGDAVVELTSSEEARLEQLQRFPRPPVAA